MFNICGTTVTREGAPYVIAEIGHNHQGDVNLAIEMISQAWQAGANAVKLQRVDAKKLFTSKAYNEPYNSENAFAETYGKHREALTLSDDDFKRIHDYCVTNHIPWICTPFEEWSADFLESIGCPAFKLASFHLNDDRLTNHVLGFNKPTIMSTGKATFDNILEVYSKVKKHNVAFLHCTSEYPVRNPKHINLGFILLLKGIAPDKVIGYSHHHESPYPAVESYVHGARIIEVHFTTNRAMKGTDQAFSLEPDGLKWLVNNLKLASQIGGDAKEIYDEERKPISKMSRCIHPVDDMKKGDVLSGSSLCFKAPNEGMRPVFMKDLIGATLTRDITADEPIREGDYESI